MSFKAVFSRLGLILFGCILALIVGEIAMRIYLSLPGSANSVYIRDKEAGYRFRPHFRDDELEPEYYVNGFGFRDRAHSEKKQPGTFRIIGIGDSFVYSAVRLDDNFLRVTEALLNEVPARDSLETEIILMGLGGYSPENYVGVLQSQGLTIDPDLVILNFFVGNDVMGIPIRGHVFRGQLYYVGSHNPWLHIARQSRLFIMLEKVFLVDIKQKLIRKQDVSLNLDGVKEEMPEAARNGDSRRPPLSNAFIRMQAKRLPVCLRKPTRRVENLWRKAESYLDEFDRLCREAGMPWILHIIPAEIQIDTEVRAGVLKALQLSEDVYDFDLPQRRLKAYAAERGIPALDPLPEMRRAHQSGQRLYIPNDSHWNVEGNRLAGELIAELLLNTYTQN